LGTSSSNVARGVLIVLAGTSGAGKGTIGARLRDIDSRLGWSVSWTSRAPRPGERHGHDYFFVTREAFEELRDAGGFLEWFEVYGDLKGTPRQWIVDELAAGRDVLMEVDVQGALAIKQALPEAVLVFVQAPSREEQRRRLVARGTEDPDKVERRLAEAVTEERIAQEHFDHIVVNDALDQAVREVAGIVEGHRFAS
jgi:guanylate kinase